MIHLKVIITQLTLLFPPLNLNSPDHLDQSHILFPQAVHHNVQSVQNKVSKVLNAKFPLPPQHVPDHFACCLGRCEQ